MDKKYIYINNQDIDVSDYASLEDKETVIVETIIKQINQGICYTSLRGAAEAEAKKDGSGKYYICAKLPFYNLNREFSTREFVQIEYDRARYKSQREEKCVRVVMGMSTSKMFVSIEELYRLCANDLEVWGRLTRHDHDGKLYSFSIKPFVVGLDWIPEQVAKKAGKEE